MGTDAVAFLCSIHANNGEVAKPELWASLPMDEENKVELLDETAERELAARGEAADKTATPNQRTSQPKKTFITLKKR